jgi:O-antigen/teichoic acid export membrane protein
MINNRIIRSILKASPLTALSQLFQLLRPLVLLKVALPAIGSENFGVYISYVAILTMIFVFSDLGFGYRFRAQGPEGHAGAEIRSLHSNQYTVHFFLVSFISLAVCSYIAYEYSMLAGIAAVAYMGSQFFNYQVHNLYRYTNNFFMMNIVAILGVVFQMISVIVGCEFAFITNGLELIIFSSAGFVLPSLVFFIYKKRSNWFVLSNRLRLNPFIKAELKGAVDIKVKQIFDMIPATADKLIINMLAGPIAVTLFYASMTVSNIISLATRLLGQITSQQLRVTKKLDSLKEIRTSLLIMERAVIILILIGALLAFFLQTLLLELLDIFIGIENLDFVVVIILLSNAFPLMLRSIYNDFCIANEFTRSNMVDSILYFSVFFGVVLILTTFWTFVIWHIAVAHLAANLCCVVLMRKTIAEKMVSLSNEVGP